MTGIRLWQIAGWTMLHYAWVGAALGAAALLARQALRSAPATVRYLAALGSVALLSVAPAAIAIAVMQNLPPLPHNVQLPVDSESHHEAMRLDSTHPTMAVTDTPVPVATANLPPEARATRNNEGLLAALNPAAMCLPWLWICGAPLSFALTAAGLLGAERLRRQSRPLEDARITDMCRQLAASLRVSYRVSVAVCDRIAAPILVGVLRPMILLPASALAGWDPQQLEMVLLHELAHVRRYDNLVNLLQRIVESLLFFQPMVWIVSGWVRQEREHCCDELVVTRTRQPRTYAEILVTLAERLPQSTPRSLLLAHSRPVSSMAERPLIARVRRILKKEEEPMQVSRNTVALVFMSAIAFVVMIAAYYSVPSRAEDSPAASQQASSDASAESKSAASAKTPADEKQPAEGLTYTGRVTDKLTGKPISGATVTVRREIVAPYEHRIIEEPKYTTDAAGKYTFTIAPEQVAQRFLYIELDVSHPDYAAKKGFGYALSMIRKNEKLGGRPFFEHVELLPAEPISGTVVTPDGRPAVGMKVLGFSMLDRRDFESGSFNDTKTDDRGAFRLNLAKGADGVFWLLPKNFAPSTHVVLKDRGELGKFTLEKGIVVQGRVVDQHGQPLAGVWVNAEVSGGPAKKAYDIPVADMLRRAALTDQKGEFTLAPLPASEYVIGVERYPHDSLIEDRTVRIPPAVFGPQPLSLKKGETTKVVELRALPQVLIEGQYYDSQGKPRSGHTPMLWGRMPGKDSSSPTSFYHTDGKMDSNGKFVILAPKGLQQAKLDFVTNEHSALRVRMKKDGPLMNQTRDITLGTLTGDIRGVEVVRYEAPILIVKPVAEDGTVLKDAKLRFEYAQGRSPWEGGGRLVEGHDVSYERQTDGRLRSEQLLPDEEFTLTVEAEGHEPQSEKLALPEGAVKELEVRLKRKS